jgi:uncharacterized membrane protein
MINVAIYYFNIHEYIFLTVCFCKLNETLANYVDSELQDLQLDIFIFTCTLVINSFNSNICRPIFYCI